ncbi:carbohydrate binding domain-containing protein [Paenibacillus kobensis]|uniref:carbohydrate binding domain-containing protein n=1 Tax=Paenibacillus kobensis TaxID=59841 RepID=UPI001FEB1483|nr:carbohydrate binding domain-containing protein [Paenibacillus kobensis]
MDTNGVDMDKWGYQLGTGSQYGLDGWGNNEQQSYKKDNLKVVDGQLVIQARKETTDGKPYSSGRLYTQQTYGKTYGKFEAKITMPTGQGIWPAFWMMPQSSEYGVWASSGEIDIMEVRGRLPQDVAGTIHYGKPWPNNKSTGAEFHFPAGQDITGEHVYGVEWEPGEIRWYVDGQLFQKLNNWDSTSENMPAKNAYPAPFDKPFYMILNLAIGGSFDGGRMPADSMLPAEMKVDYVRVYDKVGGYNEQVAEPEVSKEPIAEPYKHAIDGNYVYDPQYTHGFKTIDSGDTALDPDFWNFAKISTFGGNASVASDTVDNQTFAKVNIANGGNAVHAVQLIQNVTLGKGRWYKLSFDAKSDGNRTMIVKFGGGADRGWGTYSDTLEAALSDKLQSYQLMFRMDADTDPLARLEFNMGLNTKPVWLGNVKLVEIEEVDPYREDDSKEPIGGNHVYNGTFDLGRVDRMTYWHFETNQADASAMVNGDRQLVVETTDGGASSDAIALTQKGIQLIEGNEYELTFKAKATADRTIDVGIEQFDGLTVAGYKPVNVTTDWATYTIPFSIADGVNDAKAQLRFLLGRFDGTVLLDDIVLRRLTNNNVGELPLADQFPLKNGDFSNGKTAWSEHVQGRYDGWGSDAQFTLEQGEMKIAIANEGVNPWDVMLMQTDFALHKNQVYVVTADLRSTKPRAAEIVVDAGGTRYISEKVNLTADKQTFRYELPVTADLTASFKLLLGKLEGEAALTAHDVYVDNVHVELQDARERAFLIQNGDFSAGDEGWTTHLQGIYDGDSSATFSTDNGAFHAEIENDGANPWDVMLLQEPLQLIKGKTYIVSFAARSTEQRMIELSAENSSYFRYLNEKVQLDEATNTFTYEFTADKNDIVGLKFLLGKTADAEAVGQHDVLIDNVRLEVKGAREAAGEKVSSSNDIRLTTPPVLSPDAENNVLGQPIAVTFADQDAWRNAVSSVWLDGVQVDAGKYTVTNGTITLDADLFGEERSYEIVVKAAGYEKAAVTQQIEGASDWSLVWHDEFDGSGSNLDTNGVNLDKWAYQLGTGSQYGLDGWGNGEQQYYRPDNMKVEDGNLVIQAKKETYEGKPYTSGRVYTQPTFTQTYGRFEARMQLPTGEGVWPAFWMMPAGSEYGTWASSGEIDIMEARGRLPEEVAGTIHFGKPAPNNKSTGATYDFPTGQSIAEYHTYAVEWEPGEIRWYVDGNLFQKVNNWDSTGAGQPDKYAYPAPFDKPFYMILNLAIGGMFDGNRLPNDSLLPATMKVDYVRVYDLTGRPYRTPTEPVITKEPFPAGGKEPVDGNLLYDADYEQGLNDIAASGTALNPTYWNFLHTPDFGGAGSASVDTVDSDKFAKLSITSGGNQPYSVQMIQYATLTRGHTYKISFDAKASANRAMSLKFGGDDDNGWATYSDSFDVALKTNMQHYEYRFTMNAATDIAARLEFNMGLSTGDIWIGNAVLEETDVLSDPNGTKEPLNNGNQIYNGTFDLGTMDRMKYWNFTASAGASATAAVDENRRALEVAVEDGGSSPDDITAEQKGMQLLANDDYQLTFDAKASADRSIGVRWTSADGAVVFAEQADIALSTSMETHTVTFTMPSGVTVPDGRFVLLLGGSNEDVVIDNVKLIRTSNRNVDFTGIDMFPLKNGDFSAGLTAWEPFTQGGTANFQADGREARISVSNVGGESWNVMLNQSNLQLSKGMTYVVSFKAKSSVPRDIQATLENATYTRRFDTGTIALTTDWQTFEYTFKMTADESVALKFLLGKLGTAPAGAHDIYFDDVAVEIQNAPVKRPPMLIADNIDNRVGQPIQLALTPDTAWEAAVQSVLVDGVELLSGQYTVSSGGVEIAAGVLDTDRTYEITVQADGYADTKVSQTVFTSDGNIVTNGSFSNQDTGWETWVGESGVSSFEVDNGTAKIDIAYHGGMHPQWNVPVSWSTQFFQSGIKLEAGKSYELSFRAWSTADRPILLELSGYNNNEQVSFNLTNDSSHTFSASLRAGAGTTLTLKYLLGNVVTASGTTPIDPHTIYIDDVAIREVKSAPVLQADTSDNKAGNGIDITFSDDPAWRALIGSVTIDGAAVPADKISIADGVLQLDRSLFTAIKSYVVSIQASGYAATSVTQEVKSAAPNAAMGKIATASSNNQPASNAIDGQGGSRWESAAADPQWIAIDLGTAHILDTVVLNWEGAFGKSYQIQVATAADPQDGDWTDVFTETNGNGGLDTIMMNGVEARHVRMNGLTRGTPYGYSLWEFEVYGTSLGGNPDPGTGTDPGPCSGTDPNPGQGTGGNPDPDPGQGSGGNPDPDPGQGSGGNPDPDPVVTKISAGAAASASTSNMPAANVNDGDTGTRWESAFTDSEWIALDLGSLHKIDSVVLNWEGAFGQAYRIQVATADNPQESDWTDVYTETNGDGGIDTIAMNNVEARHVRMNGTTRALPYGYSLWEFEVFGTASDPSSNPDPGAGGNPDPGAGGNPDPGTGGNPDPGAGGNPPASGTNLALHAAASASSASGAASFVTDGILSNRWEADWAANNSNTPEWVVIDLGAIRTLTTLKMFWERAYAKGLLIEVSDNGTDWQTIQTIDRPLTIDVGQSYEESVDLSGHQGQYIRLYMTEKGFAPYGPSLYEVEVY